MVSAAIISIVYGVSGLSERPTPRLSNATTRYRRASASITPMNRDMSAPRPAISNSTSPVPCTS